MTNIFSRNPATAPILGMTQTATRTGFALDTAYVYGVSGKALAIRFYAPVSAQLTDVYFFMSAHAGTPGNITVELRNYSARFLPGATVHATQTVSPGVTDNKWIRCTFGTPPTVVQGVIYFIVFSDPVGVGNNATLLDVSGMSNHALSYLFLDAVTSTTGFSVAGTDVGRPCPSVLKFDDGTFTLLGMPYTNSGNYASSQLERGFKISGLTEKLTINGVVFNQLSPNISGMKIYKGTTAPGGTPDRTITFPTGGGDSGAALFAPYTFEKNTIYRPVLTYSANSIQPMYFVNEDTSQADTIACGLGGGNFCDTIDNGAGGWTDNTGRIPAISMMVYDQVEIPASLVAGGMVTT